MPLDSLEAALADMSSEPFTPTTVQPGDPAEIVFTSGTTAEPRGVVITHGNIRANLEPIANEIRKYARWERFVHPIRFLDLLPLSHVFGQFMGLFVPQLLGGEVHFRESLGPSGIVDAIRRERISVAVVVPRMLHSLQSAVEREYADRGRLEWLSDRVASSAEMNPFMRWIVFRHAHRAFGAKFWAFVTGGAALDESTELFWRRLGFAVVQGYGMTETAALVSVNHPFRMSRGSIGKALPGHEVRLGEAGEIEVRGANVTPGYWDPVVGIVPSSGEWLPTGDIGALDAEGNLFFKGRKKNVIVTSSGLNVYPEDIEAALNRQPGIREAAVVEYAGSGGPEPAAAIIRDADHADLERAVAGANRELAEYQRVRTWIEWPEVDFPRTPTQKVVKRQVAEVVNARLAEREIPASPESLAGTIGSIAGAGAQSVTSARTLADLGLDSLGRVELMSAIEDRYQVDVDEAAFGEASTVGEVARLVQGTAAKTEGPRHRYPEWAGRLPVRAVRLAVLYGVILPIANIMCRVRVEGRSHLASVDGEALFVSNHITSADAALILSALPGRFRRHLAIAMLGEMLLGWLEPPQHTGLFTSLRLRVQYVLVVALFNVFPLPQQSGFRRSFAFAGTLVERGNSILVFPEGIRTATGEVNTFRSGVGVLAEGLRLPVVPVRIKGLHQPAGRRKYFFRPGAVTIAFGPALGVAGGEAAAAIALELEARVRAL
ncbi:MAG TPA: AMP-binding protein [Blastocatellia bacterium]|nr:AMP-binding protein [Blastocatellia bacterium]